jgi:homoserine dehydrogenase
MEIAKLVDYDVLIELTPLKIFLGQPAIDHISTALNRKKHAISSKKSLYAKCNSD